MKLWPFSSDLARLELNLLQNLINQKPLVVGNERRAIMDEIWGSLGWLLQCIHWELMSSLWENCVWSLGTISIWNGSLLVGNTVYGPGKIDVVIVTKITSQNSVATVVAELKEKEWLHNIFGSDNTCSAMSWKMDLRRYEAHGTQGFKEPDARWSSHQFSGLLGLEFFPIKVWWQNTWDVGQSGGAQRHMT